MRFLGRLLLLGSSLCFAISAQAADEESLGTDNVQELITQLGDDDYLLRQRAENRLLKRGVEVFVELQAASNHADLEIGIRAKYLLSKIKVEWTRSTDTAQVRAIMSRYGQLSFEDRRMKIAELAKLEPEQGFGALCRIVRYESKSSGRVSRTAALAILERGFLPAKQMEGAVASLAKEMGDNNEVPLVWVRVYADQLQSPQQMDARWLELLDTEIDLVTQKSARGSRSLLQVLDLLEVYLDLGDQIADAEAIVAGLQRRIDFQEIYEAELPPRIFYAFAWLKKHAQWEALTLFEEQYAEEIEQNQFLMYYLAICRDKQGQPEQAEALAKRAFQTVGFLVKPSAQERNKSAQRIVVEGCHDWAEREWQAVIDMEPVTSYQGLKARIGMSEYRLYDRLEYKAAADLLTETLEAIESDPVAKAGFQAEMEEDEYSMLKGLVSVRIKRDFYLACDCQHRGDFKGQQKYLELVYRDDKNNADVFIAMFQMQEATEKYRKQSRERLRIFRNELVKKIRQFGSMNVELTGNKARLAEALNHWAWLVSNTEGDFQQAVAYSEKSLELIPGSPAFLDTLGRCYYTAGDFEKAVKTQRKAVAKYPHMQVMQRQLKLFEEELMKSKNDEARSTNDE